MTHPSRKFPASQEDDCLMMTFSLRKGMKIIDFENYHFRKDVIFRAMSLYNFENMFTKDSNVNDERPLDCSWISICVDFIKKTLFNIYQNNLKKI